MSWGRSSVWLGDACLQWKNLEDPATFLSESLFLSSPFESRSQDFTFFTFTFCICNFVILTDIYINQGLYTTWGGSDCSESSWNTLLLFVSLRDSFCPMQQKTIPVDKYKLFCQRRPRKLICFGTHLCRQPLRARVRQCQWLHWDWSPLLLHWGLLLRLSTICL